METSFIFRRAIQALLPATLLLASCSKSDEPAPPAAVDQGQVVFVNAASHIAPTSLKFLVDNVEKATVPYGSTGSYQILTAGSRPVQVTAGTQTALSQNITVEKGKNYTFVATPSSSASTVGGLFFTDDLTAPAATKARIRVINLGQSLTTPIRLSQVTTTAGGPVVVDIVTNVNTSQASAFLDFTPASYALSILDNSGAVLAEVGDGSGTGTGTKTYEAGKIYTVLVTGTRGSLNNDQKLKAFLAQYN